MIELNCYAEHDQIRKLFPIRKASEFYPEWFKSLDASVPDNTAPVSGIKRPTMRSCSGFIDLYSKGFMIPMWSDLVIEVHPGGDVKYMFADQLTEITYHGRELFSHEVFKEYAHIKIGTPWRITTESKVDFMFSQPHWNHSYPLEHVIPSGVVNYYAQHGCDVNMFVPWDDKLTRRIEFKAGDPLVHIVPLSSDPIKLNNYYANKNEWETFESYGHSFMHNQQKTEKFLKD